jgi:CubicO group peptidase (beta-lactamase class C family)
VLSTQRADPIMKPGMRIALYTIIMLGAGILLFKDIPFLEKSPCNFEIFVNQDIPGLLRKRGVPAASIAIIQNGAVSQVKTYGYVDIKNKRSNSNEIRYRVASLSKPLTAWGIMKLVQDGKLELDTPVEDYLSQWKFPLSDFNSNEVTVRRLLTHTAGVSVPSYGGYAPNKKRTTIIESLNGVNVAYGPVKLIASPGTVTRYSGGGYTILQLLVEEVSGMTYEKFMGKEILGPLKLSNYTFTYNPISDDGMLALPYGRNNNPLPIYLYTEKAAGGFICSIEDLAKFLLSFVKDQDVLSPEIIKMMTNKDEVPIIGILESDGNKYIGFGGTTLGYSADM